MLQHVAAVLSSYTEHHIDIEYAVFGRCTAIQHCGSLVHAHETSLNVLQSSHNSQG